MTISQSFLVFHPIDNFEESSARYFVECLSLRVCLMYSPHPSGVIDGVKLPQRWNVLIASYQGNIVSTWLITSDTNLDYLLKVASARFAAIKLLFLLLPPLSQRHPTMQLLHKAVSKSVSTGSTQRKHVKFTHFTSTYILKNSLNNLFCEINFVNTCNRNKIITVNFVTRLMLYQELHIYQITD